MQKDEIEFARAREGLKLMGVKYNEVVSNSKQILSLTSLTAEGFDYLYEPFSHRWEQYYRHHTLSGRPRTHPRMAATYPFH